MISLLLIYLLAQIGLAFWVSRKITTDADYFLAGRQFSYPIVSLSLFATWFGAETCIGSSGAVFEQGLSGARADPIGYGVCLILFGALVVRQLWSTAHTTLSDFFKSRYGIKTEIVTAGLLSLTSMIWAAAQLRAFGQVFTALNPDQMSFEWITAIAISAVTLYGCLGGLKADMITDSLQSVLIVLGVLALVFTLSQKVEQPITSMIANIEAARWSLLAPGESLAFRINRWSIPIFGSLMAQELVSRVFAARSRQVAVRSCWIAAGIYMLVGAIPVFIGLIGPQLNLIVAEPEHFLIVVAQELMSPILFVVFVGAILAALLATLDSVLLAISALITHNFASRHFQKLSNPEKLRWSRWTLVAAGAVVYFVSLQSSSILDLLELASSLGSGGLLVIGLFGLWTLAGNERTALYTLFTGLITVLFLSQVYFVDTYFLLSVIASFIVFVSHSFYLKLTISK